MKILIRTLFFHFLCILIFFLIYLSLGDNYFKNNNSIPISIIDYFLLSTTVQAGVGITYIFPFTFLGKMLLIIQQLIMISTNVISLYLFTL